MSAPLPATIDLRLPRAFVGLALALGLGTVGSALASLLRPDALAPLGATRWVFAVAAAVALSSVVATARVMRRGASRPSAAARGFGGAAVLAGALAMVLFGISMGEPRAGLMLVGAIAGIAFVPAGALLGLLCSPVLRRWDRLRRNPSHAGAIALVVGTGAWLLAAAALGWALDTQPVTRALAVAALCVGALAMLAAALVKAVRVHWLSRVALERVSGWTIRELSEVEVPLGLPRWSARPDVGSRSAGVLCRVLGDAHVEARMRIPAALLR
ncbi:MAG: hypothetical protein AAF721_12060 [Myxococcota bacterium]